MNSIEQQLDFIANNTPEESRRTCTDVWLTRDGRALPVREMEDTHLLSTMGMLIANTAYNQQVHAYRMMDYARNAPDGAAEAADEEAAQLMEASRDEVIIATGKNFPIVHTMASVVIGRGLDWVPTVDENIEKGRARFTRKYLRAFEMKKAVGGATAQMVLDPEALRQMDQANGDLSDIPLF